MRFPLLLLAALLAVPAVAQPTAPTVADSALSERRVAYQMDVALDPEARTITGQQRLTWRNAGPSPVEELQFHLYLNAFQPYSTFLYGDSLRIPADQYGGVTVDRMVVAPPEAGDATPLAGTPEAVDLTDRIRFIQPDDDNRRDSTVIAVTLPAPVGPGETITLDIDFTSQLPYFFQRTRTGWTTSDQGNPFFMAAQWFPKLGVYEIPGQRYVPPDTTAGRWNTHQFHPNTEFYADFGTYEVTMTVPEGYVVGASGLQLDETTGDGTRTLTYRADDVHDFAWTASPDYLVIEDQWRHVHIRLLLMPQHRAQADRHLEATKIALEKFDDWVGAYPYTTLTVVDGIGGSGGMEYPTLFTVGTSYQMPDWVLYPELVTIHEFGHQYFYGLLASNEFEETWLDEGITSYVESRIMDEVYGPVVDLPGLEVLDGAEGQRLGYTKVQPSRGQIYTYAWQHRFGDYGKLSYAKPATVLHTLERYLGWETMREVLRTYYDRWRFRHPTTRDFIAVTEEVSGQDLSWFFDSFIYGDAVVDYAVVNLLNYTVYVERKGDGVFPQTIRVTFEDGTVEDIAWDGVARWERFAFPKRITEVYIDPENEVWLDIDRLNNRRSRTAGPLPRKVHFKVTTWLQHAFFLLSGLF